MKESDIRPADLLAEYLRLSAQDAQRLFDVQHRKPIACVACGSNRSTFSFNKSSFDYVVCDDCDTLYQSPRPPLSDFERLYNDSPSSTFWATRFFPAVAEARRGLIFKPRAEQISDLCHKKGFTPETVIDVGAGHGIFLEEWRRLHPKTHVAAVEPGKELAQICRNKGLEVLETIAEEARAWEARGDLVTCFEVIEHAHEPLAFVRSIWNLVKPGGYAVISGLGVDGFDIQVLWENSKSVSPPHHINFMSVQGFETLFKRAGFDEVQVLTPGKLDVDIVRNTAKENPSLVSQQRFAKTLLKRGAEALSEFQTFLAKHQLSSHVWIMAHKK
jgi:SAM-dependent methyltransferase